MTDQQQLLLTENASILSLLPSLSLGLLKGVEYIETVYRYLDRHQRRAERANDGITAARLEKVKTELEALDGHGNVPFADKVIEIDQDKTVLLAYTFGSMYTEALALATGNGIRTEVFDDSRELSHEEIQAISANYLCKDRGKVPVFVRMLAEPPVIPNARQAEDPNVYLQIRRMLEKLNLTLNLQTFTVETSGSPVAQQTWVQKNGPEVTVNVYNWYCSCEQFGHHICKTHTVDGRGVLKQICQSESPFLSNWFGHSGCNHITPLPICMHLLALVLSVHNMETVEIASTQIRDFSEI